MLAVSLGSLYSHSTLHAVQTRTPLSAPSASQLSSAIYWQVPIGFLQSIPSSSQSEPAHRV